MGIALIRFGSMRRVKIAKGAFRIAVMSFIEAVISIFHLLR